MLRILAAITAAVLVTPSLALASTVPLTFATSYVQAAVPHAAVGRDAGVDVSHGAYVRVSASGSFVSRTGFCGARSVGPSGCGGTGATTGALVAAFTDSYGRLLTSWTPIGQFAVMPVPLNAKRLVTRVTGLSGHELGAYQVVADVVPTMYPAALGSGTSGAGSGIHIGPGGSGTQSALRMVNANTGTQVALASTGRIALGGSVGNGPSTGVIPGAHVATRSDVQYALRRLAFSAPPSAVTAVMGIGVGTWLNTQLSPPDPSQDTSIIQGTGGNVEALPVLTGNSMTDGNFQPEIEDRLFQWQVNTQWQVREKMTLHWLDHFAVSYQVVGQAGDMEHYIQTVRADALGNYAKLLADVSKEPAMMLWLSNANNNGNNPNFPPNENFGREIMQLYSIGLNTLNSDGSQVPDPNNPGQSLATYQEQDVKKMALALTGFQLQQQTAIGTYPAWVDTITFNPSAHAPASNGGFLVMGQTLPDGTSCPWTYTTYQNTSLNSGCVMDNAATFLANNPTTWAYESLELLKRFVNENPDPAMVKRITTVWGQTVNDPHQMAKVIAAIAADPEFYSTGKYSMIKEPVEWEVDAIRALGGATTNPVTATNAHPMSNGIGDTSNMHQEMWDPPSVFSFYYPGNKEQLINNAQLLGVWNSASDLAGSARTAACANCNIYLPFTQFAGEKSTADLTGYMLDALVDGGTPQLNALVKNFLNNNPNNVQGALWIILTSPEYGVN